MSSEQLTHDSINLARLLRRLEKSTQPSSPASSVGDEFGQDRTWLKTYSLLQKARYARKLLKNVSVESCYELHGDKTQAQEYYASLKDRLDKVMALLESESEKTPYNPTRPEPLLPTLPVPVDVGPPSTTPAAGDDVAQPATDLLLSPSDTTEVIEEEHQLPSFPLPLTLPETLLPPSATKSTTIDTNKLQSTTALHNDLSDQLSEMATQLRRNALHFQSSLVKDKMALDSVQDKLEENFGSMQKQSTRLKSVSRSRWGGWKFTAMWIGSIGVVILSFVIMVWIIRFT